MLYNFILIFYLIICIQPKHGYALNRIGAHKLENGTSVAGRVAGTPCSSTV